MADDLGNNDKIYITVDLNEKADALFPSVIAQLFKHNKLTDDMINKLSSNEKIYDHKTRNKKITYSKKTFNLDFPLLKKVIPEMSITEQREELPKKNPHGKKQARYYKKTLCNNKYLLCNHWAWELNNQTLFTEWLQNLDTSVIVKIIPVKEENIIKNKPLKDFTPSIEKVKNLQNNNKDIHNILKPATPLNKPYNRILYGAPGTGKSYLINQEIEKYELEYTRVTFYDGYTYGQFVGSYKPVPICTKDGENSITYEYVAGPLMNNIVKAINDPSTNYCLIIEEINRARADRVFGNIFQLLDRNNQGESQYEIDLSKEQKAFLGKAFLENELTENYPDKLKIPKNLYIWATMNSADQGVYVLDSAFKRRWNFEHMGLDDNQDEFGDSKISYQIAYGENKTINWNDFRTTINDILISEEQVHEDKLLAPFFIKDTDFTMDDSQENIAILDENVFIGKILMYLFDDILKHKKKHSLFAENINTFSQLKKHFTSNKNIFTDGILQESEPTQESTQEPIPQSIDDHEQ